MDGVVHIVMTRIELKGVHKTKQYLVSLCSPEKKEGTLFFRFLKDFLSLFIWQLSNFLKHVDKVEGL